MMVKAIDDVGGAVTGGGKLISTLDEFTKKSSTPVTSSTPASQLSTPSMDPKLDQFLSRLLRKNQDGEAHKNAVAEYNALWDTDRHTDLSEMATADSVNKRRGEAKTLALHYYNLVTDFYEYGWGQSFHFSRLSKGITFKQSIASHEHYLASRLQLKPGMNVLDAGCGVGGPLREISRFSGANVIGLNCNEYQVNRCKALASKLGLSATCTAVTGSFEQMPFADASFDATYAIEATCHASKLENVYKEMFRVLKPGASFACYEWLVTDNYDLENPEHRRVIRGVEEGDAVPKLSTFAECLDALRSCGFEIIEYSDRAEYENCAEKDSLIPWYKALMASDELSLEGLARFNMSPVGRWMTDKLTMALETVRLVPAGTRKVSSLLNDAADNLVKGGQLKIFTPMFFFLARKPLSA